MELNQKYYCKRCLKPHSEKSKIGKEHKEFASFFKINPFEVDEKMEAEADLKRKYPNE